MKPRQLSLFGFTAAAAILAGLDLAGWIRVFQRPFDTDFADYYLRARVGLDQGWGMLYDVAAERREWLALPGFHWYPALIPPPQAWLAVPFTVFPVPVAYLLWSLLLAALLLLTWWLLAPGAGLEKAYQLVWALGLFPVVFALMLGQGVIPVAASVAIAWWLLRRNHQVAGGLALVVMAVKPQLAFLEPFALLAAGYRRAFLSFAAAGAVVALLALAPLGPGGIAAYAATVYGAAGGTAVPQPFMVPRNLTITGLVGGGVAAAVFQVGFAVLALAVAYHRRGVEVPIAAGLVGSLLVTPYIHVQDLAMLVVAGWLGQRAGQTRGECLLLVVGYLAVELAPSSVGGAPLIAVELAWLGSMLRRAASTATEPRTVAATPAKAANEAEPRKASSILAR